MNEPLVHVLVINWNGLEHLEACFASLLATGYGNVEIVLIDNASTDGSVAFVKERFGHDPRVAVVECETNLGWSRGNNVGIERALEAGADYVFLLNNDTATAPDAIPILVEAAEKSPSLGALAAKMLLYDTPAILNSVGIECSIIGGSWDLGLGRLDGPRWNEPQRVIGACGGAAFFRAEALRRAGLLPTDFGIYLDDLDLCLRIWDAGYEILSCPGARVRHKFSATMGQGRAARRKYYLTTRNRSLLLLRNFPLAKLAGVLPAYAKGEVRAVGRSLLDGEPWRVAAHVRSWLAGLAAIPRCMAVRAEGRLRGLNMGRFWPLVRKEPLFFPGVELPNDGWYREREAAGVNIRPMSAEAQLDVAAGPLRLTHVNCYPHLGPTCVEVSQPNAPPSLLETSDRDEFVLEVKAGPLDFKSRHIFEAEATGERVDIGGWIGLTPWPKAK